MWDYQELFQIITELVMHHSPSGVETEINQFLMQRFAAIGVEVWCDRADNIIAKIPGKNPERAIAITAHKDEIGAIASKLKECDYLIPMSNSSKNINWKVKIPKVKFPLAESVENHCLWKLQ